MIPEEMHALILHKGIVCSIYTREVRYDIVRSTKISIKEKISKGRGKDYKKKFQARLENAWLEKPTEGENTTLK